jgi:hypothetical protein
MIESLALTIALGYSQYQGEEVAEATYKIEVSHEDTPMYLWGGYEAFDSRMLGQPLAETDLFSVGLGSRKDVGDFFVFGEIGWGFISSDVNHEVQQEIIYTELVGRHNVEGRPVPVTLLNEYKTSEGYESVWELSDGMMWRVGVGYAPTDSLSYTLSYRPFLVEEHIEIYDQDKKANGGGWWQETRSKDLSSFELAIRWSF